MNRGRLLLLTLVLILLCLVGLSGRAGTPAPAIKWEYKVLRVTGEQKQVEETLNKAGEDGWELAGTVTLAPGPHFICKRPR
jgi:hypothetical protein